jgi:PadR family transcriptional regulator PadR
MVRKPRRITSETAAVLDLLARDPGKYWYGLEIITATGLPSGSCYPILIRLDERGFLESITEDRTVAAREGRRPRRYYRVRPGARDAVEQMLAEWREAMEGRHLPSPRPASPSPDGVMRRPLTGVPNLR